MKNTAKKSGKTLSIDRTTIDSIIRRAHYLASRMVFIANHRDDKEKGDPKVGGHVSASASALHIMGALHLVVRNGFDHIANKPHASPTDHVYHYLLNLFLREDASRFNAALSSRRGQGLVTEFLLRARLQTTSDRQ